MSLVPNYRINIDKSKSRLTGLIEERCYGGKCPICGHFYRPNGTGGYETSKIARWVLKTLPWDSIIQRSVSIHDWRFAIGNHPNNLTFKETNEEFGDNIQKDIKAWVREKWWRWTFYYAMLHAVDDIYEWAVGGSEGKKSWNDKGCLKTGMVM